jgi:hypothetical protein
MGGRIRLVQGDTSPRVLVSLTDPATGNVVDVSTAASVVMKFRRSGETDVLQTIPATLLTGALTQDGQIDTTYTVPGSGGRVAFSWPAGALDVDPGDYEGEVTLTTATGDIRTVYRRVKFHLRASF